MSRLTVRTGTPTGRSHLVRRLLVGALALSAFAGVTAAGSPPAQAEDEPTVSDVTIVQANIYTGLTVPRFQQDVRTVLSLQPDFVTYNEVPFRNDAVIAPAGYDLYRDMRNRFTAATPVAWRTDRWQEVDHGTYRISNWRGRPPGRQVELGRRFVNWVTLQDLDGRVLSVVSVHVAPLVKGMPDLLRRSVTRLGALVDELGSRGPVLLGGDFNVHYRSGRYPADILSAHTMVPTFDTIGSHFPTGDHRGATIDYVFNRGTDLLRADEHYAVELNSDHDAVVAGLSWQSDLPDQTQLVTNDPAGDSVGRRAVLATLVGGISAAEPGSTIKLVTTRLDLPRVVRRLGAALDRGVNVRVLKVGPRWTAREHRLDDRIAAQGDRDSSFRQCVAGCQEAWREVGMPPAWMMVRDPAAIWKVRFDANRPLTRVIIDRSSRVRVSTGAIALQQGQQMLSALR